jgi:hypothetical protein
MPFKPTLSLKGLTIVWKSVHSSCEENHASRHAKAMAGLRKAKLIEEQKRFANGDEE